MKKIIALVLVLCLACCLMAGCGNGGGKGGNDEMPTINVAFMALSVFSDEQTKDVEAAVNAYTQDKIGVKVDLVWYDAMTYATQIPMAITGNEKLDLMMYTPVPMSSYSTFFAQGQLIDMAPYLKEHGKGVMDVMGDYMLATTVGDAIYGVGCVMDLYSQFNLLYRADIAEQLGLTDDIAACDSWSDWEDILEVVVAETDLAGMGNSDAQGSVVIPLPYVMTGDDFSSAYLADFCGDGNYLTFVEQDDPTVKAYYTSAQFENYCKIAESLGKAGVVYEDAATSQDYKTTQVKNQVVFAYSDAGGATAAATLTGASGFECAAKLVTEGTRISTGSFTKFGYCMPVTCTEPEAAAKFLNLLYTDKDFVNLLVWGIEGADWVKTADGKNATYPEGVTAESGRYHMAAFLYGYQYNALPWMGDDWTTQLANNAKCGVSAYMGFAVNGAEVNNEITSCNNAVQQYTPALVSGSAENMDATMAEFRAALEAGGMQTIVDTYQAQLDAWLGK